MYTQEEQQQIIDDMSASIYNKERTYTEDELGKDAVWIEASKAVYKHFNGSDYVGTPEELAKEGLNIMGEFNYNMTFGTAAQTVKIQDADDYTKTAFYYMMDTYDKKDVSSAGVGRAFKEMALDPLNYAMVIGTAGVGFFGKQAAGSAAKGVLKEGLKQSAIRYMTNPVAVGAVEGAAYTVVDDGARQDAAIGAGYQEAYDPVQGAVAGAVGAGVGGGLVKATDVAVKGIGKGINKVIESGEEEMMKAAGGGTPPVIDEKDLIIQHNLSEKNLAYSDEKGGIPVPSMAITNKGTPLEGFGEITMLGDEELAKPSKDHKVFGADIYSPRHPRANVDYKGTDIRQMDRDLEKYNKHLEGYADIRDSNDVMKLEDNVAMKMKFLEEVNGENVEIPKKENGRVDYYKLRQDVSDNVNNYSDEFSDYVKDYTSKYNSKEYFYSDGKKKDYTEKNVVNYLKSNLRGGEGFNYGMGTLRASYTKQFKNLNEVRKNKDKLVDSKTFEQVKDEVYNEFSTIQNDLGNIRTDTLQGIILDSKPNNIQNVAKEYGVTLSDKQAERINNFKSVLVEMPTEYFESKMMRKMELGEFKIAVIPANASDKTKQILDKNGIEYTTYDPNLPGDRVKQIQKTAEEKGYLFSLPASLGLAAMSEDGETNDTK